MERRKFLGWVSVGVLASNLSVVLAACNSDTSNTEEPQGEQTSSEIDKSVREDGFQALGSVEQLDQEGKILDKTSAAKPVLVFRNPDTNTIAAVNPTCTHQGCTVEFKADAKDLACPCHGSKFSFDGEVIEGPASKPLDQFEAKQEDNFVLVKVS
ncbi:MULTISPECIES: ubiquinol-cytochrome c reductase iron-sulfur subunit [unclassified Coleofasciculus]|uniref:QcrA and Rieske domain-containing protein n=1 Tax=unclassified Coleofasciculus TaxID=2692782 RepID=UPI001882CAAA|nr:MULTISPECIES: Rieske 2Fe-2S domain-containing protein [unclassified Coleofasciculus]MBE9127177.1 Rieske 2Fe-2S domain-containing protein [Coleofasciculus sp. LEGE 07081]MBE9150498.1 Rieske 2Fe-2S domain-containing protein [Coleofasciculus sp. LEGE 07092]